MYILSYISYPNDCPMISLQLCSPSTWDQGGGGLPPLPRGRGTTADTAAGRNHSPPVDIADIVDI